MALVALVGAWIGWGGIILIGIIFLIGIIAWSVLSARQEEDEFNELVLYVLHNKLPPNEARKLNRDAEKISFSHFALIRRLQILRDSIEISLTSKKRKTAESRMALVKSSYEEIKCDYSRLVTHETMAEIDDAVSECFQKFNTNFYTNGAKAHLEKAEKLKTKKSKIKYASLAMETILEGFDNPDSEKGVLEKMRKEVEMYLQSLEESN